MPAESALAALITTAVFAGVARAAKAVDTGGAVAGLVVGGAISFGAGLAGLGVLGTFFIVGSVATKIGWKRKSEEGTAERGGGSRGAARVLGKGGVAAAAALIPGLGALTGVAIVGALAAALGDTLGTEIGTLARGKPRLMPTFRQVPAGTPGAVSVQGTLAAIVGAVLVAAAGFGLGLLPDATTAAIAAAAGFGGAMVESLVVSMAPGVRNTPGTVRNVMTTAVGAVLAGVAVLLITGGAS